MRQTAPVAARRCDLADFPYADRFPVHRALPDQGRPRADVLAELEAMATEEDRSWESGKVSGTMYCGDHEHYAYLTEAFGRFAHVNALQRDLCPSSTRFEGEMIAMTLDLMHADAVTDLSARRGPAGLVTTGGSGSILHAVLAYREQAYAAGNRSPNFVKPETAHVAFDKACHLLGVELRVVPVDPGTTLVTVDEMAKAIDDHTMAIVGSAGNYPYGTIDPIASLGELALERGVGLHVDGCLGGFILPFGEELGYDVPRLRLPASRASPRSRRTRTSTATPSRARRCCCSATRRCATGSTSTRCRGAAASTCRRPSRAPAPAACSPRPGRRWCTWAARATGATPPTSSAPPRR